MFFTGNGLDGMNVSTLVIDNLKLYEVDMIPFFQYFNVKNINKSVSVPYQGVAPIVEYVESDFSLLDKNIYGLDSFYVYQPSGEVSIQAESAAAAAESAIQDPIIAAVVTTTPAGANGQIDTWNQNNQGPSSFDFT
jgi:type II secretory pathway component GspD/PulD (secretin)